MCLPLVKKKKKKKKKKGRKLIVFVEYIGQLEAEVANKTSEGAELRAENTTLKSELQQLQDFTRSLLRSPAFSSFLAEFEKQQASATTNSAPEEPIAVPMIPDPQPNYNKDRNPNTLHLGNDDWALAYGPVAGAPIWATTPQVYSVYDLPQGPDNVQNLSGKATNSRTANFIDWSVFPPPVDGFSPNFGSPDLAIVAEQEGYEVTDFREDISFPMPDHLEDLVIAKEGKISDRIERLAPGVGLDSLLGRLEAVINGEADAKQAFTLETQGSEVFQEAEEGLVEGVSHEDPEMYRKRCRDVAKMFDVLDIYKRVGSIVGI